MEGSVDLATIERYVFGFSHGRMTEVQDLQDAYYDDEPPAQAECDNDDVRVFTLINAHLRTVTRIRNRNPPWLPL